LVNIWPPIASRATLDHITGSLMSNFECGSPRASPWHLPVRPLGGILSESPAMAGARVEGSSAVENVFEKTLRYVAGNCLTSGGPSGAARPYGRGTSPHAS